MGLLLVNVLVAFHWLFCLKWLPLKENWVNWMKSQSWTVSMANGCWLLADLRQRNHSSFSCVSSCLNIDSQEKCQRANPPNKAHSSYWNHFNMCCLNKEALQHILLVVRLREDLWAPDIALCSIQRILRTQIHSYFFSFTLHKELASFLFLFSSLRGSLDQV
jgi:hypothetical protein